MSQDLELFSDYYWVSPYVYTVFVALEEKGLPFKVTDVKLQDKEQKKEDYQKNTLTGRVPALRHNDFYLAESAAIVDYLEEAFPEGKSLYPKDVKKRARARQVLGWIRSDLSNLKGDRSSATVLYEDQRASQPLSEKAAEDAKKLLHIADQLIPEDSGPILGEWSIADADLVFVLQRLNINKDPVPPKIKKYVETQWARPSVQKFVSHKRPPYVPYY